MYHDSGGSLQQNLINVARRFENERAQEIARLRSQCQSANVRADAEMDKLKVERARSAELEQKLKEEAAQAVAHSERADGLQEQCTRHRLQALGCFLILADLRSRLAKLAPQHAGDEAATTSVVGELIDASVGGEREDAEPSTAVPSVSKDSVDNDTPEGKAAAAAVAVAAAADGAVAGGNGDVALPAAALTSDGQLTVSAAAYTDVRAVLKELPSGMNGRELVAACKEGKGRAVDGFMSQIALSDAVEATAQDVLVEGLEAAVSNNRGALLKTLLDAGADVHRTSALHLAIQHGHVSSKRGMCIRHPCTMRHSR